MKVRGYFAACVFALQLISGKEAFACDPNENCPNFLGIHSPECEARKAVCNKCVAARAVSAGTSIACVVAVFSYPPSAGAICGGASVVQAVQNLGGC
jgi:hypothetical protein